MRKSISIPDKIRDFLENLKQQSQYLLPHSCALCSQQTPFCPVCPSCCQELPTLPEHSCPICLETSPCGDICGACLKRPPDFERVIALYPYTFPVDQLIHQLKYSARFSLAHWWGRSLAREIPASITRIIPLPLHRARLAERGFNQALELAKPIAKTLKLPLDRHSLQKIRHTPAQTELSLTARRTNLADAFSCNSSMTGEHVLLIDDVMTTGATLQAASHTLKRQGCTQITACVVARGLKHH